MGGVLTIQQIARPGSQRVVRIGLVVVGGVNALIKFSQLIRICGAGAAQDQAIGQRARQGEFGRDGCGHDGPQNGGHKNSLGKTPRLR